MSRSEKHAQDDIVHVLSYIPSDSHLNDNGDDDEDITMVLPSITLNPPASKQAEDDPMYPLGRMWLPGLPKRETRVQRRQCFLDARAKEREGFVGERVVVLDGARDKERTKELASGGKEKKKESQLENINLMAGSAFILAHPDGDEREKVPDLLAASTAVQVPARGAFVPFPAVQLQQNIAASSSFRKPSSVDSSLIQTDNLIQEISSDTNFNLLVPQPNPLPPVISSRRSDLSKHPSPANCCSGTNDGGGSSTDGGGWPGGTTTPHRPSSAQELPPQLNRAPSVLGSPCTAGSKAASPAPIDPKLRLAQLSLQPLEAPLRQTTVSRPTTQKRFDTPKNPMEETAPVEVQACSTKLGYNDLLAACNSLTSENADLKRRIAALRVALAKIHHYSRDQDI